MNKGKQEDIEGTPSGSTTGWRLWLFRIIAITVVPVLLFLLTELGLRIAGYGYPASAIIKCKLRGRDVYCHNLKFGWRFFPKNISREFDGFVFDTDKSTQTYRIFVLGASAAAGMPAPAYNFGRILQVMLNDMYPQTDFEVITAATAAINSHVVLQIAKDCAKHQPDLFIVYLGNNEIVGPFGPGTIFAPLSSSLLAIRANITLKSTRVGQLLDWTASSLSNRKTPGQWRGLAMFLEKQIRHDSPALNYVYSHFVQNLRDICNQANKAGAKVIISNVGCNLKDSAPFGSLHKEKLTDGQKQRWDDIYNRGVEFEAAGNYLEAINNYLTAAEIDETFADIQFRLGRCRWATGEYEKAKQHYIKALQFDTLRFRADAGINEIIRSVAGDKAEEGIHFVDAIGSLEENSPHRTPGEELFYEHVHFKFKGNYILARTIFSQIQKILPEHITQEQVAVLTEEQCVQRLIYTGFDRHFLLNSMLKTMVEHPPFTNQLYHDDFVKNINRQAKRLQVHARPSSARNYLSQYNNALRQNPEDWMMRWRFAALLGEGLKDRKAEEIQLRKVIEYCPYDFAYLALGQNLHQQGRLDEAKEILYQLLKMKPMSAQAHFELAAIFRKNKDNKGTIKHLSKGIKIEPTASIRSYIRLAKAYHSSQKTAKAIETLYKAIEVFGEEETAQAHAYLGSLLNTQGKYDQALRELQIALKINPNYANDESFQRHLKYLKDKVEP